MIGGDSLGLRGQWILLMISPALSVLSALPFVPSPNSCVTVKFWRRLVVIVASYASSAAAIVEGCGATQGPRSNAAP